MTDHEWRVGNAVNPLDTDPIYKDEMDAIQVAEAISRANWNDPVAVWNFDDDIVHLFLCGQQFRPS